MESTENNDKHKYTQRGILFTVADPRVKGTCPPLPPKKEQTKKIEIRLTLIEHSHTTLTSIYNYPMHAWTHLAC